MIIIGFCKKTSKIIPKILCRKFKHVAPIVKKGNHLEMWQFIRKNHIYTIPLKMRDLNILTRYGWEFIAVEIPVFEVSDITAVCTCVGMTKHFVGIKNWRIQTPNALYKKLISDGHNIWK